MQQKSEIKNYYVHFRNSGVSKIPEPGPCYAVLIVFGRRRQPITLFNSNIDSLIGDADAICAKARKQPEGQMCRCIASCP